ncbi:uncharacterized protein LOC101854600 [Aplysia californica]|uniref:Uncharacterized protein LOC101854600 n=1 Tax=Aplysia californica TaxID=6500 RepID=A0ABM0K169_APLCA|nr:uncharacterized protein LOC101854600 [Aplysia californica]XP_035827758.1 uncharacterized protein LOC101854600 [Aplysia californica]
MHTIHQIAKYSMKKRKRSFLSVLCCVMIVYAGVQFMYLNDDYSPLQLLSSVENEATRLMRFMGQVHLQCNVSLPTNNASTWVLCLDQDVGLHLWSDETYKDGIVYSIGPSPDFSFERMVADNLSHHLYIFSAPVPYRNQLIRISNTTSVFKVNIVPNDPADFARNSFDTQTLNSVMSTLKHGQIDVLKLDSNVEGVQSYDVLRFLVEDGILKKVKELHIVLKLDKVEEDDIYSWYRALYGLFHTAGFRLYHSSTSDPLCLQATIMESCIYYMSWVRKPPPHILVMYPPAIDGSLHNEEDRMVNFLEQSSSQDHRFVPVPFNSGGQGMSIFMPLTLAPRKFRASSVFFFQGQNDMPVESVPGSKGIHCQAYTLSYEITNGNSLTVYQRRQSSSREEAKWEELTTSTWLKLLKESGANILVLNIVPGWTLLSQLSYHGIPKYLDEVVIKDPMFSAGSAVKQQPMYLRRKYSEMKRLEEFGLRLTQVGKFPENTLKFGTQEMYWLYFVRKTVL